MATLFDPTDDVPYPSVYVRDYCICETDEPNHECPVHGDPSPKISQPDIRQMSIGFALLCDCGKPAHIPHCCGCGG